MNARSRSSRYEGNYQVRWSPSSLFSIKQCARYYEYKELRGLRTYGVRGMEAANWGRAFHSGLEVYDSGIFEGLGRKVSLCAGITAALDAGRSTLAESGDNSRTLETLVRALVWYDEQYADDAIRTCALADGSPALETRFEVPIPGTSKKFSGRLDRIAEFEGNLWIQDTKTTNQVPNEWYFKKFKPNIQSAGYLWALRLFLDRPIHGFLVNAVQTAVGFNRFARGFITMEDGYLEEFEKELILTMAQADVYADANFFPKNETSCDMFKYGCIFRSVCAEEPEFREAAILQKFEVSHG